MSDTLVIYAHPSTPGHCPEIFDNVLTYLDKHKIKYDFFNLYKMKYDPVLHEDEHYTAGAKHRKVSKVNKAIQKQVLDAKKLIFVYPVWWGSMPAILKGFIEKVFVSHFAFKYVPAPIFGALPKPLLKGKKALVFITTGGPWWAWWFFMKRRAMKHAKIDCLRFFGVKAKVIRYGPARQLDDKIKEDIHKMVYKAMKKFY